LKGGVISISILKREYTKQKPHLQNRLLDFKKVWSKSERKIFEELCFCICTPQSNAIYCDKAVKGLAKSGDLFTGSSAKIRKGLRAVRFPNNKSRFIFEAQNLFSEKGKFKIKDKIFSNDILNTREWLVKNIKGYGYKEASHFLRNIGFGNDLAILDVHILRNMVKYNLIDELPKTINRAKYIHMEDKLRGFSKKVNIPMDELDLLFWSQGAGKIFK